MGINITTKTNGMKWIHHLFFAGEFELESSAFLFSPNATFVLPASGVEVPLSETSAGAIREKLDFIVGAGEEEVGGAEMIAPTGIADDVDAAESGRAVIAGVGFTKPVMSIED